MNAVLLHAPNREIPVVKRANWFDPIVEHLEWFVGGIDKCGSPARFVDASDRPHAQDIECEGATHPAENRQNEAAAAALFRIVLSTHGRKLKNDTSAFSE